MSVKVKDIKGTHHGYDIKLNISHLSEEEQEITLNEYNKKYGVPGWIYCDTLEELSNVRPCAHCGLQFDQTERYAVDPCYGRLEGVWGACCGHGNNKKQYIHTYDENARGLTFEQYTEWIKKQKENAQN